MPRGRPREFDRDKALQDALLVFWRKGFHPTSIADLCEAVGVNTPSLYAAFGSKEDLYAEAVELYMKAAESLFWRYLKEGRTARTGMQTLLHATAKEMVSNESHPTGCFVTLALVDEDMPPAVSKIIRKSRRDWLEVFRSHIKQAIAKGELTASTNVDSLSRFFQAIVQSIGIQAHDGATQTELEGMVETAMGVWPKRKPAVKSRAA
jgi:AcrR family transcriptional regulator